MRDCVHLTFMDEVNFSVRISRARQKKALHHFLYNNTTKTAFVEKVIDNIACVQAALDATAMAKVPTKRIKTKLVRYPQGDE